MKNLEKKMSTGTLAIEIPRVATDAEIAAMRQSWNAFLSTYGYYIQLTPDQEWDQNLGKARAFMVENNRLPGTGAYGKEKDIAEWMVQQRRLYGIVPFKNGNNTERQPATATATASTDREIYRSTKWLELVEEFHDFFYLTPLRIFNERLRELAQFLASNNRLPRVDRDPLITGFYMASREEQMFHWIMEQKQKFGAAAEKAAEEKPIEIQIPADATTSKDATPFKLKPPPADEKQVQSAPEEPRIEPMQTRSKRGKKKN